MGKKKVLMFLNSMKPAGGIERVVANLANNLSEDYEITILVKDKADSFYELKDSINIISLNVPLKLNMNLRVQRLYSLIINLLITNNRLKNYIKSSAFEYIYVTSPFNALEIFLCGKKHARKLVISEHGSKFGYNKIYIMLKKYLYPKAYKISVPTTMDTDSYISEGCDAVYIPHLSTFSVFQKTDLNSKTVLNIGRLTADKQQIILLRIWNDLRKEDRLNGWKLKIIGRGEEENILKEFVDVNNLQNCVEISPPIRDVGSLYKDASLFAFTSKFEGFGMVLLEAMSFGLPCISFDCPSGPRDLIEHKFNGVLIKPYDHEEYKNELSLLLNERNEYLSSLGNEAYLFASNWNNEKIMDKWKEIFKGDLI
jgi:glycosyltransferase involved in cell wall biosynthesis